MADAFFEAWLAVNPTDGPDGATATAAIIVKKCMEGSFALLKDKLPLDKISAANIIDLARLIAETEVGLISEASEDDKSPS